MKHTIILPDGRAVSSGAAGSAIRSVKLTESVNPEQELCPGGVCAAELELELLDEGLTISAGDELVLSDETGVLGIFLAQKPTRSAPGRLRVLAYDRVTLLDTAADSFLEGLSWPCTLEDFAHGLCACFGLELTGTLLNADLAIPQFQARGVTGRQLLQWVCQVGGRFCRALPDGRLALDWYRDSGVTLGPSGPQFYYQGSLRYEDYTVAAVDRVHLGLTETDVGVAWPDSGTNTLSIIGNYLLTGNDPAAPQNLLPALEGLTYTPCVLETAVALRPGDLFTVETDTGSFRALAMTVERSSGRFRVSATGSATRSASAAVCRGDYRALSGRMLNVVLELDGVQTRLAQFGQTQTQVSQLSQDADHISARVAVLETGSETLGKSLEELEQTAKQQFAQLQLRSDALEVTVGSVQTGLSEKADAADLQPITEHFRFDADGLTISDSATGMGLGVSEDRVVFLGGESPTTQITPNQMQTTNLQVLRQLDLGAFSLIPRSTGNLSLRWTGA